MDIPMTGTNAQIQMNAGPVQQPLNQNSQFFGYDSFKDFFRDWLDSTFGYKSHMTYGSTAMPDTLGDTKKLIGDQENRWLEMLGYSEDTSSFSPSSKKLESMYDDVYTWIREALNAGVNSANENWLKTAEYNAREAQKNRDWQEYMSNTQYQRAVEDLKKAGINPLLAFDTLTGASTPSGSAGSMSTYNTNSLYNGVMSSILGDKKIQVALLTIFSTVITSLVKSVGTGLSALFG